MKASVPQERRSKRIKYIQFGIMSPEEIHKLSELEIWEKDLYNVQLKIPAEGGALDRRLGTCSKDTPCDTCGKKLSDCVGHFGHIRLALPVFHAGYLKATIQILQQTCKICSRVLLDERSRRSYLKRLRSPFNDNTQKMKLVKQISAECKKCIDCPFCGATNGTVKKIGVMKIIHEPYRAKSKEDELQQFRNSFRNAIENYPEIRTHYHKAQDDLNPLKVLELFKRIPAEDCELLGLDPESGRPELFIWTSVIVPPVCIRPSVAMDRGDAGSNEDDLTVKLAEIITINQFLQAALEQGDTSHKIAEDWDFLQIVCAQYVNSELPGLVAASQAGRWIRGICQRLKGKQGRFRGNLSGKRVDFSGRTVISPDPNLSIDEVAVPDHVAKTLTYPEVVNNHNIEKLRQCIINGADIHPGANFYAPKNRMKRFLRFVADREALARELKVGDMVERHLNDGDIVLFNRQPSLHKLSIMAHFVKVKPGRTFRFNECVCTPYNADFDGDEMNLHVPQTEEARAEAIELMGVKNNLVTPRNGQPLIAATQDFITGSYLISRKDTFFTRQEFTQIACFMTDASIRIDLPAPAIIKPVQLWTGKQIMSILLRPNKRSNVLVNLETKNRSFIKDPSRAPDLCPNEGWVVIHNSQLLCGAIDKALVGDGNKESMFYVVLRDFGPKEAAQCMNRVAKLCSRWLGSRGFSIGIDDVTPGERLSRLRDEVINKGYQECDKLIEQYKAGTLKCQPGCDMSQTLEAQISGKLSRIRDDLGQICLQELNRHNAPLIMSLCGSKGSKINVCQMVACVGQQIISGSRVADGFDDRTLPHFKKHSRTPAAKGFVRNSFYTGLTPTEFIFHAASGREGLVDTAVKTAETGYMQRRLMKALEDLAVQYDFSVRNSIGTVIQFDYGNDSLDPSMMEGESMPVEFRRTFMHCQKQRQPSNSEKRLAPEEIIAYTQSFIRSSQYLASCSEAFVQSLETFISKEVAGKLHNLYTRFAISATESAIISSPSDKKTKITKRAPIVLTKERHSVDQIMSITQSQLNLFFETCRLKFHRARIEPGTAVGALGAQSIGEPGTQMTLKTFHFAGVASMNVTLGVPRIKEIINASKNINTPIITAALAIDTSETVARIVKGRIETTRLGEIADSIEEVIKPTKCFIEIKLDRETINALQLEITTASVCESVARAPKLKITRDSVMISGKNTIRVMVREKESGDLYYQMQILKRALPSIVVKGIPQVTRAVINEQEGNSGHYELLAEGYGLREVMITDGVVGSRTTSNHVMEVEKVLGIEAARQTIIDQIQYTMGKHGMTIDFRHVMLLADVMCFKGEVLGITRFGIAKMKDSALMLASFEKTADHLFDAAVYGKRDAIEGVSECIIMGIPMQIGTGNFKLLQRTDPLKWEPRPLLFDREDYHPPLEI